MRSIRHNTVLSFCPGAVINGKPKTYLVEAGEVTSPHCSSLTLSIAYPRVFHNALHTGSSSARDFGLHTFPKSVLRKLETIKQASWKGSFRPPSPAQLGAITLGPSLRTCRSDSAPTAPPSMPTRRPRRSRLSPQLPATKSVKLTQGRSREAKRAPKF